RTAASTSSTRASRLRRAMVLQTTSRATGLHVPEGTEARPPCGPSPSHWMEAAGIDPRKISIGRAGRNRRCRVGDSRPFLGGETRMSADENKELIRRYIQA